MPLPRLTRLSLLCLTTLIVVSAGGCGSGGTPIVWLPTLSPAPGTYAAPQSIALSDPLPDARIYYTTDGTEPTTASKRYTGPIFIASTTTLAVTAAISGYRNSPTLAATYVIAALTPVATPTFTPLAGTYAVAQSVSIGDSTSNAQIFYTTDGTTPTPQSTLFTSPIQVAATETLQAIATAPNFAPSPVATATYTIAALPQAAMPTFSPGPGTYATPQGVQISDATPGASIFYTTDGTAPTTASTLYTAPIPVAASETIQAIATAPNFIQSAVTTAVYTIGIQPLIHGDWTWMGGPANAADLAAVYGTLGVPAASNTPGSRFAAMPFTGIDGTFYLFGGADPSQTEFFNDVWKLNPATAVWTWIGGSQSANPSGSFGTQGVSSASNAPPPREGGTTWTDSDGNLWLFGGDNFDLTASTNRGDLWKFAPATSLWTWIGGSQQINAPAVYGTLGIPADSNYPGARSIATGCNDQSGNLYLFGGASTVGYLNDLWRYSPATNQWTWLSGSQQGDQYGVYGTLGIAASGNFPGGRIDHVCWTDQSGNLWIFGGQGYDNGVIRVGYLEMNDLWEFNATTHLWAWMAGSDTNDSVGSFGTQGVSAATNEPAGRQNSAAWTDGNGNFWLFGGSAFTAYYGNPEDANDLWRFEVASGQWTWMTGSDNPEQPGTYGALGVPAAENTPGAREVIPTWVDTQGGLWLYGGPGSGPSSTGGFQADLWRYQP